MESKPLNRQFLRSVAQEPGVYLMRDKADAVIYVGKAINLCKRLTSYTRRNDTISSKTDAMLAQLVSVETILTRTEKEAFILEASLIKKHRPKYNVLLRDDKNYPLIKVTVNETWPRLMMCRRRLRDGARYFGPFSSTGAMWGTIRYLHQLFPTRRCKGKSVRQRNRPCLNQQMGRCPAPCTGMADRQEYGRAIDNIIMVLEGRGGELIRGLEHDMRHAVQELRYEEAALCRDRLKSLAKTLEKQAVVSSHEQDQDVFSLVRQKSAVAVSIVRIKQGLVIGHRSFYLDDPIGDEPEVLSGVLKDFYGSNEPVPEEVLLPFAPADQDLLTLWLADLRKQAHSTRMYVKLPRRGDGRRLLDIARANAEQVLNAAAKNIQEWQSLAVSMQKVLSLRQLPGRIECVDISNLGESQPVGSMVCFINGKKETSQYRRYKIRQITGPNDYAMMRQVLQRRLGGAARPQEEERPRPDLILVDGGKGQLHIAREVLRELDAIDEIDLIGIAKERAEEGEKLYRLNRKNPVVLPRHAPILLLLMRIRDEAHRFAVTYHRQLRHKETMRPRLQTIPGVGPSRQRRLLKHLGSFKQVVAASERVLAQVPGIGPELARQIRHDLDKQQQNHEKGTGKDDG